MQSHLGRTAGRLLAALAAVTLLGAKPALGQKPVLVLATVPEAGLLARAEGRPGDTEDPGYYAELASKAAAMCGADVEIRRLPWGQAFAAVKVGDVSATFATSFREERTEFGAFPMKDGELDLERSHNVYSYYIYARRDDGSLTEPWKQSIAGETVGVARASSVISTLKSLGAIPDEHEGNENRLTLLSEGRFRYLADVSSGSDRIIDADETLRETIVRLEPPLEVSTGYVMFNRQFYQRNQDVVECYWSKAAELKKSSWYESRLAYYEERYDQ